MKAVAFAAIVLVGSLVNAQVLVVSDSEPAPTLAPSDCNCELCDCVDCDGNCGQAKPKLTPVSVVARKVEQLDSDIEFLNGTRPEKQKASANPNIVYTSNGVRKYEIVGYQAGNCSTGLCKPVAVYGWKFYPTARPQAEPAKVQIQQGKPKTPIKFANQGVDVESAPANATYQADIAPTSGYYSVSGPASASYGNGYGCAGDVGCGGYGSGCAGYGSGCGGNGRVGLFGRRGRGLFGWRR